MKWKIPVRKSVQSLPFGSSVSASGSAKVTSLIRFETSDVGPYEDMLLTTKQAIRWDSPDVGPYEIAAPKVNVASRFEISSPDAYES